MGRGGLVSGFFHQLPVCGEVSGDDIVVEAEPEDLDAHAGPSGPIAKSEMIKRPFRERGTPPRFFPRKRPRVVTRAILAVFIFEIGPELAVEPIQGYVAGTEPIMPKVFALAAFLRFFSQVL